MKKKMLNFTTLVLMIVMTISSSCQKRIDPNCTNEKSNVSKVKSMTLASSTTMSLGQLHNEILREYDKTFGLKFEAKSKSVSDVRVIIKNLTQIAIEEGAMNQPDNIEAYLDTEIDQMISDGYFDNNGMIKPFSDLATNAESMIENQSIRAAINTIHNYNGPQENFLTFANNELNSLTGLSSTEQETVTNYGSILNESTQFWNGKQNSLQPFSVGSIAQADADGAVTGYNAAMKCGYWWLANYYAGYYAARCSIIAAK